MPSKGNLDVYLHAAVKPNSAQYYEMLLDDMLHITHHKALDQNKTMKDIRRNYQLKDGSAGEPSSTLVQMLDVLSSQKRLLSRAQQLQPRQTLFPDQNRK
jgi:hypothetical protein